MSGGVLVGAVILWIVPIFVAVSQGKAKNRTGFAYGLFLGWLGVIILALLPSAANLSLGECPHCREAIRPDASVCPHCQRDVAPTATAAR